MKKNKKNHVSGQEMTRNHDRIETIEKPLQDAYEAILQQPVPDRLTRLVDRLRVLEEEASLARQQRSRQKAQDK